jgi:hypothetical protein
MTSAVCYNKIANVFPLEINIKSHFDDCTKRVKDLVSAFFEYFREPCLKAADITTHYFWVGLGLSFGVACGLRVAREYFRIFFP